MVQLLSFSAINMIMNAFSMFLAHLILLIFFFFAIMEMQKRDKEKIGKKVVLKFISSKFAIQNSNV